MEQGLAASVTNMYGDGSNSTAGANTTTHYYAGKKKKCKKKGKNPAKGKDV